MHRTPIASALIIAGLAFGSASTAYAAAPELFYGPQVQDIPSHVQLPAQTLSGVYVRINHDLFDQNGLSLTLPNGKTITAGRQKAQSHPNGSQVWAGGIVGDADGSVVLAQHGAAVAGVIRTEDGLFKIQPIGNGVHIVVEVSKAEPFPEFEPQVGSFYDTSAGGTSSSADVTASDDGSAIDVMIAYSSNTKDRYNGVDGVNAMIAVAIAETNQAYLNSGISTQLRLVHTVEVQNATGNFQTDLYAITDPNDGVLDNIHDLRDQYGADLVSWFMEGTAYCGIAWVNTGDLSYDAGNGFSVVASQCATGYFSTGHEMGHNMGSTHDHANGGSAVYSYSFGYQEPNNAFRTVMAYNCPGGCTRVQHFSNPNVSYAGKPTGVADYADNARSINQTRIPVSQWRTVTVNAPPSADFSFACTDLDCNFSDTSTASNIISRSWDFGDGGSSVLTSPQHSYAAAGDYTVVLTITDNTGSTGQQTRIVSVTQTTSPPPSGNPPAAPLSLNVADDQSGAALISWFDDSDNETGFELEREKKHPKNGKWVSPTLLSVPADTQSLTDSVGSGDFHYRIRSINAYGDSGWSAWENVTVTDTSGGGGGSTPGGNGNGKGKK